MRCSSVAAGAVALAGIVGLAPGTARGHWCSPTDSLRASESFVAPHRFLRTAVDVIVINTSLWTYDRYFRSGGSERIFRVSWDTVADNLKNGYEWDDNIFWTNEFYHPVHGSLFFAAARANGYGHWASAAWTSAGTWLWENAAETNFPSINDAINSTFGGMALGEPLFRLSDMVLDNRARGGARVGREIAAAVMAPGRALNRIVTGEAWVVHQNSVDRLPNRFRGEVRAGARDLRRRGVDAPQRTIGFAEVAVRYGDAFETAAAPFHYFDFDVLFNPIDAEHPVGRIRTTGLLASVVRGRPGGAQHVFGAFQYFDFDLNEAYEYGDQSVGTGYVGRYLIGQTMEIRPEVHVKGILLGAATTDYIGASTRTYDYGAGLGYEAAIGGGRTSGWDYVTIERRESYLHAVNGNDADHRVAFTRVAVRLPLWRRVAAGGDYCRYTAHRVYRYFPDVNARSEEFLAYISLSLD